MVDHLLPGNATRLERAVSETLDRIPLLGPGVDLVRGFKYVADIKADFAPWVVAEYGLGPISAYFGDPDDLIEAGIAWQRVRGTPLAISTALAWLEYNATTLQDAYRHRRKWNRYQIGMGKVPAIELPVLADAEYLVGISDPARSVFFRGWHGYDVRAMEWSGSPWSGSMWGDDSGVRLPGGSVKWSHGEDDAGTIVAGEPERIALGINAQLGDGFTWGDFPWTVPGVAWDGVVDVPAYRSYLLRRLPVYVGFYDALGGAIGYRRPIAVRDVTAAHAPVGDEIFIEVECRTGFGDGASAAAASCALVFRAAPADPARPGKLWLNPDEIAFEDGFTEEDMTIGALPVDFLFRRTVRQHVTITLEI